MLKDPEPMGDILIQTFTIAMFSQRGIRAENDSTGDEKHCSQSSDSCVDLTWVVWPGDSSGPLSAAPASAICWSPSQCLPAAGSVKTRNKGEAAWERRALPAVGVRQVEDGRAQGCGVRPAGVSLRK